MSRGGLCATLTEAIAIGTGIELDLQLVFTDELRSEPLRLAARIAWCTEIDDRYQIGVTFLPLHPETAADLTMFLRFLDGRVAVPAHAAAADASVAASSTASGTASGTPSGPLSLDDRFG